MGKALAEAFPIAAETFAEADALLGFPLSRIAWEGPAERLNDTRYTQPALVVHSMAALRVLQQRLPGFRPAFMAGHSLGELSALIAAGSMTFADGLRLTRARGEAMHAAGGSQGGMAAILGLDLPALEAICREASTADARVEIANDNCPGQVVLSGHKDALKEAMRLAQAAGARRVVPLSVSVAAHSYLMAPAQEAFNRALADTSIRAPEVPVVGNIHARPLATADEVRADLQAQLTHRVRWTESVRYMLAQGVTTFVEIGTGNVLTGLIKRIERKTTRLACGLPEACAQIAPQA
jgi:[acyl-carrier-protein] S-malonyltransferase